jgi:hypothetical protein
MKRLTITNPEKLSDSAKIEIYKSGYLWMFPNCYIILDRIQSDNGLWLLRIYHDQGRTNDYYIDCPTDVDMIRDAVIDSFKIEQII